MNARHNDSRRAPAAVLIAAALIGLLPQPAAAEQASAKQEVRIAVDRGALEDPRSLARIRRQIASAADALCDPGGVASIYGNGARRCRERAAADAERQLAAQAATRLASRADR